jgi:sigma-B regulation protein RsbU (phosphoserine phosphatase)
MSSFRASLLSQRLTEGPAEIFSRLNGFLHRSVEPGRFVTAFLGVFDLDLGTLVYCNAGHNPPYVLGTNGAVRTLKEGGLVLGLFRESVYEEAEVTLQPGDTLALFTDGVTEAQNAEEELWGEERLLELLQAHQKSPCRRIVGEILSELRRFSGDEPQSDDITLLLARWWGTAEVALEPAAREVAAV